MVSIHIEYVGHVVDLTKFLAAIPNKHNSSMNNPGTCLNDSRRFYIALQKKIIIQIQEIHRLYKILKHPILKQSYKIMFIFKNCDKIFFVILKLKTTLVQIKLQKMS